MRACFCKRQRAGRKTDLGALSGSRIQRQDLGINEYDQDEMGRNAQAGQQAMQAYEQHLSLGINMISEVYPGMDLDSRELAQSYCRDFILHR